MENVNGNISSIVFIVIQLQQMEMVHLEPEMDKRNQQKVVVDYANYVGKAFIVCPSPKSRKQAMEKFLASPNINVNTPNNVQPTRLAIAQICFWQE